jgi:16S rRNA (cytosine967-C5)-methyltransferase
MTSHAPRHARTGDARARAAEVLTRVEADGAFAAAVLDAALDRGAPLDARDRGLATELVYGVLRTAPALDEALARHARDGAASVAKLDPYTRAVLRVGAYQVLCLSRVPVHAAVGAAVEAVKRSRSPRLAGFANAVLRKVAGERPAELPDDARVALALRSVPAEVRARIAGVLGDDGAEGFLRAALGGDDAVVLRAHTHRASRDAVIARLRAELPGATVTAGRVSPLAVRVSGGGDPTATAVFREGLAGVQEEAAQCVAQMAAVRQGMSVLDVCAGRGGKSVVAAMGLARKGSLHAVDLFPEKLTRLREELARLGLDAGLDVFTTAADLTRGVGALAAKAPARGYDVVMVDAPCSGLGTLGHRPDLVARLRDGAGWSALVETQQRIVETVAPRVAVGGTLLYAVCTLTRDEGDAVIERFLAGHANFAAVEGDPSLPERLRPARVVLDAATDGTDGFMAWRLRRSA